MWQSNMQRDKLANGIISYITSLKKLSKPHQRKIPATAKRKPNADHTNNAKRQRQRRMALKSRGKRHMTFKGTAMRLKADFQTKQNIESQKTANHRLKY